VRPRLRIPQLLFLLGYAHDPAGWRRQRAAFGHTEGLLGAMAEGFSHLGLQALERGVLHGYVLREDQVVQLRGRLRFAEQIARAGGMPLPTHVAYDDFTSDVLENRMLLTSALVLLRLPRITRSARRRLMRIRSVLLEVAPLSDWRDVAAPPITRLNYRYGPALRLAEIVLRAASLTDARGDALSTTFVFDMNDIFEDFLTVAFREAMRAHGGSVKAQHAELALDEGGELGLRPDLTWWVDGVCRAVLDAKYKAIDAGVMRNGDAYQMLAYCIAYGLPRGHLVYARDSGEVSRTHVVGGSGHRIVVSAIDVEQEPEAVLSEVAALAAAVAHDEALIP
jgi:5-methylcytosine-specific restriction enzyme subunit McrC